MKKIVLFLIIVFSVCICNAQNYLSGYPSYDVKGIYELNANGNYTFNGKRYSEYKVTSNDPIDTSLGRKIAPKTYNIVDPEGDDLDLILVFDSEPPYYVANSYGVLWFHTGYVEKPQGVKGLEQCPDRYYVSFRKWYYIND